MAETPPFKITEEAASDPKELAELINRLMETLFRDKQDIPED